MAKLLHIVFASVFVVMSSASCVQKTSDIKVVVEEIDEARNPVPSYSDLLTFRVVVIEGAIWGPPGKEENLLEQVEVGSVVSLDMGRLLQIGSRYASTVTADASNADLVVAPRDMRFARLGTFPAKPLTNQSIGSGSFLDKQSRDFLALLYVDRPGLISGTLRAGNVEGKVHVSIDKAGLHWIKMKEVTPLRYELDNANPSELVFGIQPYPVPSLGPSE
ncbi:hypothetical protein DW355_09775 [Hylemonella gracilis]|uniref:Lipoprotein n=1 Tax=Hylemonella gracilis TaxID=80880 RepID=A0A4V1A270_9BURK|nr:hypothetical protein [Hylemonella gracilis]QBK05019.1 hypothetical protein DW355_09775 [Hylemonella gracilis]